MEFYDTRLITRFVRPGEYSGIEKWIIADIARATQRVIVASAWFSSVPMAEAIEICLAPRRWVITNDSADLSSDARWVYDFLSGWAQYGLSREQGDIDRYRFKAVNAQPGIMHHKFVVTDDTVRFGSYNFTHSADQLNYEFMAEVWSKEIADEFEREAAHILGIDVPHAPSKPTQPEGDA